jgi:hypothetical protein
MAVDILAPISVGELFDKISILEIKLERLVDPEKLAHVQHELGLLQGIARQSGIAATDGMAALLAKVKEVNKAIWEGEDQIRNLERRDSFGEAFLNATRSIHRLNDERASTKRAINILTSSSIVEEKSHGPSQAKVAL